MTFKESVVRAVPAGLMMCVLAGILMVVWNGFTIGDAIGSSAAGFVAYLLWSGVSGRSRRR